MNQIRQPLVFITLSLLLAACASGANLAQATPPQPAATATQAACQPSLISPSKNDFPETQGTMQSAGEMWALLFFDKAVAGQEAKIVWRVTGTGKQFDVLARNEAGTVIRPVWGPDYHGSSTWDRPGEEWGTGFNFPQPGCWTITVMRGATIGEIRLEVLAP